MDTLTPISQFNETTVPADVPARRAAFAFEFHADTCIVASNRVIGRQSAGASLLKAIAQFKGARPVICRHKSEERSLQKALQGIDLSQIDFLNHGDLLTLSKIGILFTPSPTVGRSAWARRLVEETSYSIVGLTHTIATQRVYALLSSLVADPVQPWDALICISRSVKRAVETIFDVYLQYLESRGIEAAKPPLQMPVLPLGIDCKQFASSEKVFAAGREFRKGHQVADSDVAVLWVGRIDPLTKAHPTPMFLAMESAQRRVAKKCQLHLILVGQYPNIEVQKAIVASAKVYAPSIKCHWMDGADSTLIGACRGAADIFISLSDNVQESFGLTPVEAMAAGLPVIASDWDGYRDTIIHGETGLLIPTYSTTWEQGLGIHLADRYAANADDYPMAVGSVAQITAVDIGACSQAIADLARDNDLRRHMGNNGAARARAEFDWPIILKRYLELFSDLNQRRAARNGRGLRNRELDSSMMDHMDPLRVFAAYPTAQVSLQAMLRCRGDGSRDLVDRIKTDSLATFIGHSLIAPQDLDVLVEHLTRTPASIAQLAASYPGWQLVQLQATCMWLLKYGVLQAEPSR